MALGKEIVFQSAFRSSEIFALQVPLCQELQLSRDNLLCIPLSCNPKRFQSCENCFALDWTFWMLIEGEADGSCPDDLGEIGIGARAEKSRGVHQSWSSRAVNTDGVLKRTEKT